MTRRAGGTCNKARSEGRGGGGGGGGWCERTITQVDEKGGRVVMCRCSTWSVAEYQVDFVPRELRDVIRQHVHP